MAETGTPADAAEASTSNAGSPVLARGDEAKSDRVIAYLVDFALMSAVAFAIWFVGAIVQMILFAGSMGLGEEGAEGAAAAASVGAIVVSAIVWVLIAAALLAYFVLLDTGDGTLGKRFADVEVVETDGSAADRKATAIRTAVLLLPLPLIAGLEIFLGIFGFFIGLFFVFGWLLIEAVVLFVSDGGQRLGDRAAGTVVVPSE